MAAVFVDSGCAWCGQLFGHCHMAAVVVQALLQPPHHSHNQEDLTAFGSVLLDACIACLMICPLDWVV